MNRTLLAASGVRAMGIGTLRVGLIGAGANTRLRHIPGLHACADVEIVAVCNRRHESSLAIAREHNVPMI
jgi:predicted dehydrogenase